MRRPSTLAAVGVLVASLVAVPLVLTASAPPLVGPPRHRVEAPASQPGNLVEAISRANLEQDMRAFAALADEHGNRAAGTPGYDAAVQHAVGELEKAGYEVELQEFLLTHSETLRSDLTRNAPDEGELEHTVLTSSPSARVSEAELVVPRDDRGCTADAWGGADLSGKVALVSRGSCPFGVKSSTAAALGAEALIVTNRAAGPLHGTLGAPSQAHVGTVGVTREVGEELRRQLARGPVTVSLDLEQRVEQRPTVNVVAETRTGRADHVVMVGAHLDGVQQGPALHDNASGAAVALEVARQAAREGATDRRVRVALWGAEEIGLLGSRHYVNGLNQPEREAIAVYVNLDMVGPLDQHPTLGVLQGDFSQGTEARLQEQLARDGHPYTAADNDQNSDYAPFVAAGIPATGLLALRDDNYHTPQDDLDNVSVTSMTQVARAVAHLIEA